MQRWTPPVDLSPQEKMLMKRLTRVRALFGFLRQHRHELFDDAFQDQLEGMYRAMGAGEEAHPPALVCMVVLLQGYVGASDAEAVELSLVDLRLQLEPHERDGRERDGLHHPQDPHRDVERATVHASCRRSRTGHVQRSERTDVRQRLANAVGQQPAVHRDQRQQRDHGAADLDELRRAPAGRPRVESDGEREQQGHPGAIFGHDDRRANRGRAQERRDDVSDRLERRFLSGDREPGVHSQVARHEWKRVARPISFAFARVLACMAAKTAAPADDVVTPGKVATLNA